MKNQWPASSPQWNSNAAQMYDYGRMNMTDLKVTLNTHHKLRSKDRESSIFNYQAEHPADGDSTGMNSNQKLTKQ